MTQRLSEALTCYSASGDSDGIVHRYFCTQRGSSIAVKPEAFEGLKAIKASSLNDNSWVQPTMDIFTQSKQPCIELSESTEKYEGLPQEKYCCCDELAYLGVRILA